jgi:hypothetical protein
MLVYTYNALCINFILKAVCLKINANFHENFENVSKVQKCGMNNESNLHIVDDIYNECKLPKKNLTALVTQ